VVEQLRCGIVVPMPSSSLATPVELPGLSAGEFSSNAQQPTEAFEMDEPYRGHVPRSPFSVRDKTLGRRHAAFFLVRAAFRAAYRPSLRQLPDPFYANDVTVWNLAPALPFARYARHVLVTVLHQLLRDYNVAGAAVRKTE
jgi:hypothetical protein